MRDCEPVLTQRLACTARDFAFMSWVSCGCRILCHLSVCAEEIGAYSCQTLGARLDYNQALTSMNLGRTLRCLNGLTLLSICRRCTYPAV
eukprot:1895407-Pleurochrysis_carterae.AAC.2